MIVSGSEVQDNPFEIGPWAAPLLVTNISILVFGILYYTKKLPSVIPNAIHFIRSFEISPNVATIAFVAILSVYVGLTIPEFNLIEEELYGDYKGVIKAIDNWPFNQTGSDAYYNRHLSNLFLKTSVIVFDNMKIVPFIGSAALLVLTYFFTVEITQKKFAGIASMLILFQSYTFYTFDSIASYPNFWIMFFLLSLYVIYKKWYLSPIAYVASLLSKPLSAPYLPLILFFTYRADIPRRKKINITISYAIIVVTAVIVLLFFDVNVGGGITTGGLTFDWVDFWYGFTAWNSQLRFDTVFLLFLLPVTVGLYLISKKGMVLADSILLLIAGVILTMPLLSAITSFDLHPYRNVPLVLFFAIGVGTLIPKKITSQV